MIRFDLFDFFFSFLQAFFHNRIFLASYVFTPVRVPFINSSLPELPFFIILFLGHSACCPAHTALCAELCAQQEDALYKHVQ